MVVIRIIIIIILEELTSIKHAYNIRQFSKTIKYVFHSSSHQTYEIITVIILILQMKKLKLRKVKCLVQSPTANKYGSQCSNQAVSCQRTSGQAANITSSWNGLPLQRVHSSGSDCCTEVSSFTWNLSKPLPLIPSDAQFFIFHYIELLGINILSFSRFEQILELQFLTCVRKSICHSKGRGSLCIHI